MSTQLMKKKTGPEAEGGRIHGGLAVAQYLNQAIVGIEPPPLKIGFAGCALGTSEPLLNGGEPKGIKTLIAQLLVSGLSKISLFLLLQESLIIIRLMLREFEFFCLNYMVKMGYVGKIMT